MAVKNMEGLSNQELVDELNRGGRFVVYYFAISIVIMTFRRGSHIYFLRSHEHAIRFGWKYLLLSMVVGWWGFPWGPIYTLQSVFTAFTGKDVTRDVMAQLSRGASGEQVTYDQKF